MTTRLTILIALYSPVAAWRIPASEVARLRDAFPHHKFLHATDEQQALEYIPDADVAFMAELRPAHLAAATRLQWVHSSAAGIGGMMFPAMIDAPVVMTNSRALSGQTIAEHVIAVTLAMFRKLPFAILSQSRREWVQDAMLADPPIRTIAGSRILIVGLGGIGSATARCMAALGARVTGIRRTLSHGAPEGIENVLSADHLTEQLPHADVIVIAAPQTHDTRGLIGARELAAMRRDALLVNVSRGRLVDEDALAAALTAGTIGGAALDVFEHEPLPANSPLWSLPNVIITPHMSGFRPDHWAAVTALFADNLRRFESGEPLRNVVDKTAGY